MRGQLPNTDFRTQPIWWDEAPPRAEPAAAPPARSDVVVVGGGFAGLATALELARNGVEVTVLEADAFGFNASARNSGGVSFGIDLTKVARWHRWAGAKVPNVPELARAAGESVTYMERFIADNAVDCDYLRPGRLSCAPTPRHYDALASRVDRMNSLFDAGAHMVKRADLAAEIGSDAFHGAMVVTRSGQLNPAKMLHGLVALCRQAGVRLHDNTVVHHVERTAKGFSVAFAGGAIAADAVAVTINAHAARLPAAGTAQRVVPVASHIIVTEPLPLAVAEALLPRRRTGADGKRLLAYFRRTPDGMRFLYGGRAAPSDVTPARSAEVLYRRMVKTFPQLDGARISHAWGCKVAFTFDGIPHLSGRDGLYYIAGCNGNGVAMTNYLGHKLARKIIECATSVCAFDQPVFPKPPLYDGRPWFLPAMAAAYGALDRVDALRAKRR
ncbi:MAG TPA: FAD-dependent oxidoreductase [Magnetospirillaceae bacterium]|jgi:glycine/D-amino acid oxidase-like deaminating enzyme